MSTLLFSRDATFRTESPVLLQTILQSLISLLPALSSSPGELESIKTFVLEIWHGGSGLLSKESIEQEFGARFLPSDTEHDIREALAIESALRCMAYGSLKTRAWVLRNLIEVPMFSRYGGTHVNSWPRNTGLSRLRQRRCRLSPQRPIHERFVLSPMPLVSYSKPMVQIIALLFSTSSRR